MKNKKDPCGKCSELMCFSKDLFLSPPIPLRPMTEPGITLRIHLMIEITGILRQR